MTKAPKIKLTREQLAQRGVEALRRKQERVEAKHAAAAPDVRLMRTLGTLRGDNYVAARVRLERLRKIATDDEFMSVLQSVEPQRRLQVLEVFAGVWGQLQIHIHKAEAPFK